ncbi:MAG: NAD-dependent epimerase/dehydratase family protein [Bacteroidota bacterium]
MKKILVTGADGLLGSNLVRELLNRGYQVRAFIQPDRKVKTLEGLAIEKFEGDILCKYCVREAIQGCHFLIHTAANTSVWPSRDEAVRKINVQGTQNIAECALEAKVERMVYVGTANSFGFGTKENPGCEENSYKAYKYEMDYLDSKFEAHQVVLETVKKGLNAIIVNPTFMIGPFDSKPGSGSMIIALLKRKIKGFANGGRNYIYVKDVATAIANALIMGRIGQGYILGNANLSYQEAFTLIGKTVGVRPPQVRIPGWAVLLFGYLQSLKARITGRPPIISFPLAKIALDDHYFTPKKAIEELKLPQTPLHVAIQESFEWFKENKYV